MKSKKERNISISVSEGCHCISFFAMASPCEILIEITPENDDKTFVKNIGSIIATEVWRIEDKYSRYNPLSLCSQINNSHGKPVAIDQETFLLLNFAEQCYQLSDGVFDITSGVLRQAWYFNGSDNIPSDQQVHQCMTYIGWPKISYDQHQIVLPQGMELDFGGIGKEYAVDKAIILAKSLTDQSVLINLGGDLCASSPRKNKQAWQVGIEHPSLVNKQTMIVSLYQGALATSGDANRYLLKAGKRYSHILNAQTGWPIEHAPHSITVVAPQCVQAGILASLALMQGSEAEAFLTEQGVKHWAIR